MSNPALTSKKTDKTLRRGLCRVLMSFERVRTALYVLSPGREPDWLGLSMPLDRAARRGRDAIILSRIFENVQIRTIILKEAGTRGRASQACRARSRWTLSMTLGDIPSLQAGRGVVGESRG